MVHGRSSRRRSRRSMDERMDEEAVKRFQYIYQAIILTSLGYVMAAVVAQWKRNLMMLSAGILFTPLQILALEVATRITGYICRIWNCVFFVSEGRLEVMLHFLFRCLFYLKSLLFWVGFLSQFLFWQIANPKDIPCEHASINNISNLCRLIFSVMICLDSAVALSQEFHSYSSGSKKTCQSSNDSDVHTQKETLIDVLVV